MESGTVQVYTGSGKGKTTAALGQAMRACGHGLKVIMIQFMKGNINYGELETAKRIPNFTIEQYGLETFVDKKNPGKKDIELAKRGLERVKEVVKSGKYDIVILDEINVALDYKLIPLDEIVNLIENKPKGVELILTGRYASPEIMKIADLVTEMLEIQHHYPKGVKAREGIEY